MLTGDNIMKYQALLISILLISACAQPVAIVPLVSELPETVGMNKVENSGFDDFFVNKNKITEGYSRIIFSQLNLDNIEIDTSRLKFPDNDWTLTAKNKNKWQELFQTSAKNAFKNPEGLSLSKSPASKILNAHFEIVKFIPTAVDDVKSLNNRNKVYTQNIGFMETKAVIRDSITGEVIAVINDKREVGERLGEFERNNAIMNNRRLRSEWTSMLNQLEVTLNQIQN